MTNPAVGAEADAAAAAEASWAARVRANREQVERLREVPDGADFYAPVTRLFRADPARDEDDPVLARLLALARPDDRWLDIGAGAGRYALPLARRVREVVALDPSESMLATLREGMAEYGVRNIDAIQGRWPDAAAGGALRADVALIAHVGYDVEAIGPFLDAMEAAASRLCVAVLMERAPASAAEPVFAAVHGEPRASLPGLPEFLRLLLDRGRLFEVVLTEPEPRRWPSRDDLRTFLYRQTWVDPGSAKGRALEAAAAALPAEPDGSILDGRRQRIGVVSWPPRET